MREERVADLPLLGCAVSERLRAMLDPLGLQSLMRRE
jgi:hypothetical protein